MHTARWVVEQSHVTRAAARLVMRKGKYDSITTDLCDVLHWLPVQQHTEYKVSLLIYKCLHQAAPLYLTEMCVPVSAIQRRHGLWSAVRGDLVVPQCNLARYGQRSFYVSGPSLWNSLPLTVRDSSLTVIDKDPYWPTLHLMTPASTFNENSD